MLGELSKLFDRNFVIGYFLPAALFAIATFALLVGFGLVPFGTVLSFFSAPSAEANAPGNTAIGTLAPLVNTTILALVLWLGAVFLLAMNRTLYRLMEGYGSVNPAHLFAWRERRRYCKSQERIDLASDSEEKLRLLREEAEQFPPEEDLLLPTRFGNTLRAFEYYSWWIYGIDAIAGWNRVVAMIPKDYQDLISEAKAQTDFWLNSWGLVLLILIEYIICVVCIALSPGFAEQWYMLWFPPLVLLFLFLGASWGARTAAVAWGDIVKASFDVYLPELGKKLGFPPIRTRKQERDLWWLFSNVVTRRDVDARREFVEKLSAGTDLTAMIREVDELRSQLESRAREIEVLQEPQGAPEMTTAERESTETQAPFEDAREPAQKEPRSWWRWLFRG